MFADAHNHLQDAWLLPHRASILAALPSLGIESMVVNGTCEEDWPEVAMLQAAAPDLVVPSFGLHPWDAGNRSQQWKETLIAWLERTPTAAVGEIGLDRWIIDRARPDDSRLIGLRRAPLDEQREVFRSQLAIACELRRPVSVHCLDAWGFLLEDLRSMPRLPCGLLLHAYSGPLEMVPPFAELGAFFSFNGSFLEPRRARLRDTFRQIPADRLLVETDAPAMPPPAPWRPFDLPAEPGGAMPNHPGNLTTIYRGLAQTLGCDEVSLAHRTMRNYRALFAIAFTASPAAVKPNAAVTNEAVPKPEEQSSLRFDPGSGSMRQEPSAQGKTGFSDE